MSRPELRTESTLVPGLAAVALFVVLAAAFLNASFPEPAGFGADAAIVRSIGAALFDIDPAAVTADGAAVASEGFLAAFLLIAVLLDAALDGSIMLAKRDDEGGDGR